MTFKEAIKLDVGIYALYERYKALKHESEDFLNRAVDLYFQRYVMPELEQSGAKVSSDE